MTHARPIPFSRIDAAAVAVVAALALGSAWYMDHANSLHGWSSLSGYREPGHWPIDHRDWSRWPYWLQEQRFPALRLTNAVKPTLVVAGMGLAAIAFRPRRGFRRARLGPGHLASAIAGLMVTLAILWQIRFQWIDPLIRSNLGAPPMMVNPPSLLPWNWLIWPTPTQTIGRLIATAWLLLFALGHRGGPIDWHDRLGRWFGWALLAWMAGDWFFNLVPLS